MKYKIGSSVAGDGRGVAALEEDVRLICQLYKKPVWFEVLLLTELKVI